MSAVQRVQLRKASEVTHSRSFADALEDGLYQGYTYSYPHKTAYRWFQEPLVLADVWAAQDLSNTFLYAHIPFCEMRCGFCNLFTTTNPSDERESQFVAALERQARLVRKVLGPSLRVTTGAIGGGTPTLLSNANLLRLLGLLADGYEVDFQQVPFSVETSPETASADKVGILSDAGIDRVSIGIQSWFADELRAMGRPQNVQQATTAVERLRNSGIRSLNIDLIYGVEGQTEETMRANVTETLRHEPNEVFLYPLYVRPLTGLGRNAGRSWDDVRRALYRVGREALLDAGFRQTSMRRFERSSVTLSAGEAAGGHSYDCQRDPMIGLGPGARSYTPDVHYSSDWAVGRDGVRSIIDNYIAGDDSEHLLAGYGAQLTDDDRRRRFVLQGLLHETGLDTPRYAQQFGRSVTDDFPQLTELLETQNIESVSAGQKLALTQQGLELSDVIGPWLYSELTKTRMSTFEIR